MLIAIVAGYGAIAWWIASQYTFNVTGDKIGALLRGFSKKVPQMIFLVLFARLLYLTYVKRVDDRIGVLKADIRSFLTDRDRMLSGLLAFLLMSLTLVAFAQLKNLIPEIKPFAWDEAFMQLDRTLHFGTLPHEFLHAVFGGHYMISLFTGLYNIWLFMMYFVLVLACFMRPDSAVRMQYLIAFLFTWAIGGNLFATVFSSAGPVYYATLGLGDAYAGLMQRLHDHAATGALTVVNTQNLLWEMYSRPELINAISAFPSMHVGSSVLMAIFAWRVSRLAGYIAWTFALLIMVGSVLLAWHYAVDGYVGALVAGFSWFLAGQIVRTRAEDFAPARG